MSLLRSYLESNAILTAADLEVAVRHQQSQGGSLDTALLELGLLTATELDSALGKACGLPTVPARLIETGPTRPWGHVPKALLDIGWAMPLALEDDHVLVAVHPDLPDARLGQLYRQIKGFMPMVAPECLLAKLAAERSGGIVAPRHAMLVLDVLDALQTRDAAASRPQDTQIGLAVPRIPGAGLPPLAGAPVPADSPAAPPAHGTSVQSTPAHSSTPVHGTTPASGPGPDAAATVVLPIPGPDAADSLSATVMLPVPGPDAADSLTATVIRRSIDDPASSGSYPVAGSGIYGASSSGTFPAHESGSFPVSNSGSFPDLRSVGAQAPRSRRGADTVPDSRAVTPGRPGPSDSSAGPARASEPAVRPVPGDSRPAASESLTSGRIPGAADRAAPTPAQPGPTDSARASDSALTRAPAQPAPANSARAQTQPVPSDSTRATAQPADSASATAQPAPSDSSRAQAKPADSTRAQTQPAPSDSSRAQAQPADSTRAQTQPAPSDSARTPAQPAPSDSSRATAHPADNTRAPAQPAPSDSARATTPAPSDSPRAPAQPAASDSTLTRPSAADSLSAPVDPGASLTAPVLNDPGRADRLAQRMAPARAALTQARERDRITDALVQAAIQIAPRVALFGVKREGLRALAAPGSGLQLSPSVVIPIPEGSLLDRAVAGQLRLKLLTEPKLAAAVGRPLGIPCLFEPVYALDRCVLMLYIDRDGGLFDAADHAAAKDLCELARASLEALLRLMGLGTARSAGVVVDSSLTRVQPSGPVTAAPSEPVPADSSTRDVPAPSEPVPADSSTRDVPAPPAAITPTVMPILTRSSAASPAASPRPAGPAATSSDPPREAAKPTSPTAAPEPASPTAAREQPAPTPESSPESTPEATSNVTLTGEAIVDRAAIRDNEATRPLKAAPPGAVRPAEDSPRPRRGGKRQVISLVNPIRRDTPTSDPDHHSGATTQALPIAARARYAAVEPPVPADSDLDASPAAESPVPADSDLDARPAADSPVPPDSYLDARLAADSPVPPDSYLESRPAADSPVPPDSYLESRTAADSPVPPDSYLESRPAAESPVPADSYLESRPAAESPVPADGDREASPPTDRAPTTDHASSHVPEDSQADHAPAPPRDPPAAPQTAQVPVYDLLRGSDTDAPARNEGAPIASSWREYRQSVASWETTPEQDAPGHEHSQHGPAPGASATDAEVAAADAPVPEDSHSADAPTDSHVPDDDAPGDAAAPVPEDSHSADDAGHGPTADASTPPPGESGDAVNMLHLPNLVAPGASRAVGKKGERMRPAEPALVMPDLRRPGVPTPTATAISIPASLIAPAPLPGAKRRGSKTGQNPHVPGADEITLNMPRLVRADGPAAAEAGADEHLSPGTAATDAPAEPAASDAPTDLSHPPAHPPEPPTDLTHPAAAAPEPPTDLSAPPVHADEPPTDLSHPPAPAVDAPPTDLSSGTAAEPAGPIDPDAEIEAYLHDPDAPGALARLRAAGGEALTRLADRFPGPIDPGSHTDVRSFPPPSVHGPLLRACVELGEVVTPFILDLVDHPRPQIRFYAAFLFQELRDPRCLRPLAAHAFDPDPDVRLIATRVLESYSRAPGFVAATEIVRAELRSRERERALLAAEAAGTLRDMLAVPVLIDLLSVRDKQVRETALEALCSITAKHHGYRPAKWKSWYAENGEQTRIEWVIDALRHRDTAVRRWAADELVRITGHRIPPPPEGEKSTPRHVLARWQEWFEANGADYR